MVKLAYTAGTDMNATTGPAAPEPDIETQEDSPRYLHCRGMRFPFDPDILPKKLRVSLRTGGYELKEAEAALKLIRKGDVVMELGAGIGFMSTLISTQTEAASVHSFEANAGLIPFIRRVHKLNNVHNATVENAVLGEKNGEATFYVRRNLLASSLSPDDAGGSAVPMPVDILDANKALGRINPTVLVCDIEGAEEELLPLMDLSGLRAVIVELHPQWIGKEGIRKIFRAMDDAGLAFFPRWSTGKVAVFRSDW